MVSVNEKHSDFAESANPAYLVVKGEEYRDPNKTLHSVQDKGRDENEYPTSKEPPEDLTIYDTVDGDGARWT